MQNDQYVGIPDEPQSVTNKRYEHISAYYYEELRHWASLGSRVLPSKIYWAVMNAGEVDADGEQYFITLPGNFKSIDSMKAAGERYILKNRSSL